MTIDPRDLDNGALGVAIVTAFANDDKAQMKRLVEDHVNSAPSVADGLGDVVHGLTFLAASLLLRLEKATGRTREELLHKEGMLFADRRLLDDDSDQ